MIIKKTIEMNKNELLAFDNKHIWHPYTSMLNPLPVYEVESAKGVYLHLADGKRIIDGMSSWWAAIHGYNVQQINEAIENQLKKMSHVMFGGITHRSAVELGKLLIEITPATLQHIFLSDSGSVSVEVAMKMAIQYQYALGFKHKNKFLTIRSGYHGDTFHAMSVCDPVNGMHSLYQGTLPLQHFVPQPKSKFNQQLMDDDIDAVKNVLSAHSENICAFILEPIVQGAGGMWFYSEEYLNKVKELCEQHNILLIFDEIATGFGRTGELFATNHTNIEPDIMCLGKALTGGYVTLAATLATSQVADTISGSSPGVFMHGPTFMGNPLACSAALASTKLLLSDDWQLRVAKIEEQLNKELKQCRGLSSVAAVRVLGAIGVVEMKNKIDVAKVQRQFVEYGVWVRPFGKLIYIMPPYIINQNQLKQITESIYLVAENIESGQ